MITMRKIERPTKYVHWTQLDVGEACLNDKNGDLYIKIYHDSVRGCLKCDADSKRFKLVANCPVTTVIPVDMNIEYWGRD